MLDFEILQDEVKKLDGINIWDELEKKSEVYIDHFQKKSIASINVNKESYILLCPIADIHLGNEGVDYKTARIQAEMIGNCDYAIAIGGGDYIDNFIKTKIIGALINQTTSPKQQIKLLQEYLGFFNGKLNIMIGGNHDRWTKELSGLDWMAPFTEKNRIIYSPDKFVLDFNFKNVSYKIKIRHKFRFNSSMNQTHTVKQMLRFGEDLFDIGIVCHHHDPDLEQCYELGKDRVFIRAGSYKVADTYSRAIGFNQSKTIVPCVILSPFERKMITFWYLDEAIKYVNYLNEGLNEFK